MSGPTDSEPPFDVWLAREAAEDVKGLRGAHAREVKKARAELERIECKAAHYRLSGAEVEHLCVLKLRDNHRMVLLFPAQNEIAVLLLARMGGDLGGPYARWWPARGF